MPTPAEQKAKRISEIKLERSILEGTNETLRRHSSQSREEIAQARTIFDQSVKVYTANIAQNDAAIEKNQAKYEALGKELAGLTKVKEATT